MVASTRLADLLASLKPHILQLSSDEVSFEQMTAIMGNKQVISAFNGLLGHFALRSKASSARILLSAFMIAKHPEVLSCDSNEIRRGAENILKELANLVNGADGSFSAEFEKYQTAFLKWQAEDKRILQANIESELSSSEALLRSLKKEGEEVQAEWLPHVNAHREQLLRMSQSLSSLKAPVKEPLEELKEEVTNVQIAHDLFLEGPEGFYYFRLYMPDHQEKLNITIQRLEEEKDSELLIGVISAIKKSLMGLSQREGPTKEMLDEGMDLEMISTQLRNGVFDPIPMLTFTLDIMSQLCAPFRDPEIDSIRQIIKTCRVRTALGLILQSLSKMSSDAIMFNVSQALPHLPSIIVQYERDAFAEQFKSNELPLLNWAFRRVYKRPDMGPRDLAAEYFGMALRGKVLVETFVLDKARIQRWATSIDNLALEVTSRLSKKSDVSSTDPIYTLIKSRLLDAFDSKLYNYPPKSPLQQSLNDKELRSFELMLGQMAKVFEHHCKVYEPVYQHQLKK